MGDQTVTGRCINCGFLARHKRDSTVSVCYEATPADREAGHFQPVEGVIRIYPCCFFDKAGFGKVEFEWDLYHTPDYDSLFRQISMQRNCPHWYPYTEHRSPMEHFEEFKMLQLEQRREEFEQRMEKERKAFETKLDERNREERRRTDRLMIWLTFAALIFGALQVYAALASINPNHWLFNWLR